MFTSGARTITRLAALAFLVGASISAQPQGDPPKPGRMAFSSRRKPLAATEVTMLAALQWLASHQSPDGHWACAGFEERCAADKCGGAGDPAYDTGVTGLALLAFLGAGFTQNDGDYKLNVGRGLAWLMSNQSDEGLFGARTSKRFQYNHACAALAVVEASGMTKSESLRGSAQKAVAWVLRSKNEEHGWRYGVADGDNDVSITGWMAFVVKSAAMAGLDVDPKALADAAGFVDEMTDPLTGRAGYQSKGGPPFRFGEKTAESFPPQRSEAPTAIGMLVRVLAGHGLEDPMILKGAEVLGQVLPRWEPASLDFDYWQFGTLAMYQVGDEPFAKWNEAMKSAILPHQHRDPKRHDYGSWDPVDAWSAAGGRVYSTAMLCLCMEVYYRYPRILGVKKK
jgi:hypothetical protein